ncbi:MAG TPA: PHB depolymerase family esterase [Roseiflexaceae bacterium]|nr:PHB depolymerase family esterase [Roseiflexaceae bacterium]
MAKTSTIDIGRAQFVPVRWVAHGSAVTRTLLLIALIAIVLLTAVGCAVPVSTTAPISPTAAVATPATSAAPTVAPTMVVTAQATGIAIPATPAAALVETLEEGSSARSLPVGDLIRNYRVYRPQGITAPAPLVLVFHGYGGSAAMTERQRGWNQAADRHGFVVIYPDGIEQGFNGGRCCGNAAERGVDDVAAAHAMIDEVTRIVPVDVSRIYAAGFSNGAVMTYRLACESDRFAAVGPVAGLQLVDCATPRPTSILHIHGTADTTISVGGAPNFQAAPINEVLAEWRTNLACAPATETRTGNLRTSTASCPDNRDIDLITIDGLGHSWPTQADGLDATETLWRFFARHQR